MDRNLIRRIWKATMVAFCSFVFLPLLHGAIDRGAIRGTISDPQGAVIPKCQGHHHQR
jgi:hypothetical protein